MRATRRRSRSRYPEQFAALESRVMLSTVTSGNQYLPLPYSGHIALPAIDGIAVTAPVPLVSVGGNFAVAANEPGVGEVAYLTDGTQAGTVAAPFLNGMAGTGAIDSRRIATDGARAFWVAPAVGGGWAIMTSDGKAHGTGVFAPIGDGSEAVSDFIPILQGQKLFVLRQAADGMSVRTFAVDGSGSTASLQLSDGSAPLVITRGEAFGGIAVALGTVPGVITQTVWTDGSMVRAATADEQGALPFWLQQVPWSLTLGPSTPVGPVSTAWIMNAVNSIFKREISTIDTDTVAGVYSIGGNSYATVQQADGTYRVFRNDENVLSLKTGGQAPFFTSTPLDVTYAAQPGIYGWDLVLGDTDTATGAAGVSFFTDHEPGAVGAVVAEPSDAHTIELFASTDSHDLPTTVERSTDGIHFVTLATSSFHGFYIDGPVAAGVTYLYRMRRNDGGRWTAYSNIASARTHAAGITMQVKAGEAIVGDTEPVAVSVTFETWGGEITGLGAPGAIRVFSSTRHQLNVVLHSVENLASDHTVVRATFWVYAEDGSWDAADVGRYRLVLTEGAITDAAHQAATAGADGEIGAVFVSPSLYFSEGFYDQQNPDVAAAIASGALGSGWQHYQATGAAEGRSPSADFDEMWYRRNNPDVVAAIAGGRVRSGLDHFLRAGRGEGRSPTALFDPTYYLQKNPDVAAAVAAGGVPSAYDHYLATGAREGRSGSLLFDPAYYLGVHGDERAAIIDGTRRDAYDAFLRDGLGAGQSPTEFYSEKEYLAFNPDVAAAVAGGTVASGLRHFLASGEREGRRASVMFDAAFYVGQHPAVAAAVHAGTYHSALEQFLNVGRAGGWAASPWFDESYYLAHNPDVAAALTAGTFASGFVHFAMAGAAENRAPSALFDPTWYVGGQPTAAAAVTAGAFDSTFAQFVLLGAPFGAAGHP